MTDPQDFAELVRRHQGAVCAVAYAVLRDRARSEEIAQEAFLIAWQKLPALATPPTLPAWICGIARNLAANAARRRKETAMPADAAITVTPLDQMLDRETEQLAERALAALPERDRDVVVLYYRGDGSIADVASTLGITELAARKRLQRGRDRLRAAAISVETALRATRPGAAFTAACVAALATRSTAPAHASPRSRVPAAAVTAVGAFALVSMVAVFGGGTSTPATPHSLAPGHSPALAPAAPLRRIDPPARAAIVERLAAAKAAHAPPAVAPSAGPHPQTALAPLGTPADKVYDFAGSVLDDSSPLPQVGPDVPLTKTTIRLAIRALQPLLVACYRDATTHVTGEIKVQLRLVGEPGIATLVDSVELSGPPVDRDRDLAECMRETLYSIELPQMTAGETWDVYYPLVVR
jgi:RNA polymerase sigma factor (sigma-70 family)